MIRVVWLGPAALVWAEGVLDGAVAAELHEAMDGLLTQDPDNVTFDLSAVLAVDDGAVAVLAAATLRLSYAGVVMQLRLPAGRAFPVEDAAGLREVLAREYPAG